MKRFFLLLLLTALCLTHLHSQTDKEFWFVAPEVTIDHSFPGGMPIFFNITTTDLAADVTIEMPSNPNFNPIVIHIPPNTTHHEDVTDQIDEIENVWDERDGIPGKSNKGFHITSTNLITIYYESSRPNNPDIWALKGNNALGSEFFATFQTRMYNVNSNWDYPAYSAFDVVFTEDNTFLTLEIPPGLAIYNGTNPPHTGTVVIGPFNAGETYSGTPAMITEPEKTGWKATDTRFGRAAEDHLNGVRITTNNKKKIAVSLKDDSMKSLVGGCYDLAGDQTVPVHILGTEYIAMRGQLTTGNLNTSWYMPPPPNPVVQETLFLTATDDNTDIYINGAYKTTLDRGEHYIHEVIDDITLVESRDSAIYCLQISGFGCEMGQAVLPTTSVCTGSTQVGFTRSTSQGFFMNIMVRKNAKDGFLLNGSPHPLLHESVFTDIANSDWAAARIGPVAETDIPVTVQSMINNTKDVFHLGIINGSTTGGTRFGYFSDYNPLEVSAFISESGSRDIRLCHGDNVQIVARGGIFYSWNPTDYLSDPLSPYPVATPPEDITYVATVSGACQMMDSTVISIDVAPPVEARFNIDTTFGCAPFEVKFRDQSLGTSKFKYFFGDGGMANWEGVDTLPSDTTFYHTYLNTTRPPKKRTIMMVAENTNQCRDTLEREIIVYPTVTASFDEIPGTVGCHPLEVDFINNSVNADYYQWEFGDEASSSDTIPFHSFMNFGDADTTYTTRLVARSVHYCADTAYEDFLVHPYLESNFTVSPTEICAPFPVNITNNSLNMGVTSFEWDFGDGNTSTSGNQFLQHTYDNNTNSVQYRTIRLIVTNGQGCTDTMERVITVYPHITSDFTPSDTSGCNPLEVSFTNNSNDIAVDHNWDFGDGSSSSLKSPVYTFTNIGSVDSVYRVYLTTKSIHNCIAVDSADITVYPYIEADFTIDKAASCADFDVTITNNSLDFAGITNYKWSFGDGFESVTTQPAFIHTYENNTTSVQEYELQLVVTNGNNCYDTLTRVITAYPKVVSDFTPDVSQGCNPLQVSFTNNSNSPAIDFNWDFGDDESSSLANPVHTFINPSPKDTTFHVSLIASSTHNCVDTHDLDIQVHAFIEADFSIDEAEGCSPFNLVVDNDSRGGVSTNIWDFGDGSPVDVSFEPAHTYVNKTLVDQVRTLQLVVKNNHNCFDTLQRQLTIYPEAMASFSPSVSEGCQPLTVNFDNNSNSVSTIFDWDFDDGASSAMEDPVNIFTNLSSADKTFDVNLQATTNRGCTDDTTITITSYAYVEADFKVNKADICSHEEITIENDAPGGVTTYFWDFENDGVVDANTSAASFKHQYTNTTGNPVTKPLKMVVKNNHACYDTLIRNILVYPKVTADFTVDNDGCTPHAVTFNNTSLEGDDYNWYFGDGGTSTLTSPDKIYYNYTDADIQRTVKLVAVSDYLCKDSTTQVMDIFHRPKAKFAVNNTIDCPPFNIQLTNNSVTTGSDYYWDFGDGSLDTTYNKNLVTHTYLNKSADIIDHTINMRAVTPRGCENSISLKVSVYPEVTAAFSYDSAGCSPFTSNFINQSVNEYDYFWTFGDGKISTQENPVNRFVNAEPEDKDFEVKLVATSQYNCSDSITHVVKVFPQPFAEFSPKPTHQNYVPEPEVSITNHTNNYAIWNYQWDFDDGTGSESNEKTFTKIYTRWGDNDKNNEFDISMIATNALHPQCADTVTRTIRILPPLPEIKILGAEPEGCEPLTVQFDVDHEYTYSDGFYWDFDDGNTSTQIEPEHTFERYGIYNVKLVVTGDGGNNYDYMTVNVFRSPEADFAVEPQLVMLPDDIIKCYNKSKRAVEYLWDFGDGNTSDERDPEHLYSKLGKKDIGLTVWSENGCEDSILRRMAVTVDAEGVLEFPNAFTPNMDGPVGGEYDPADMSNDIFFPLHKGVSEYKLEIYNRWGELLFESDNVNIGWDGYFKDKLSKQDVYVWKVKATFYNGRSVVKAGDVTLLHKNE